MNNIIKPFTKNFLLLLFCSLFLTQCTEDKDLVVSNNDLDATIAGNSELSLFKAAIIQAKLETYTKGPGPFTLFAPTNAALIAGGITTTTLPTIDSIALTAFIMNHFQNIKRTSFEIPDGPNAPMASMAGFNNFAYNNKIAGNIFINGAKITAKDVVCSNGIIHVIDKALFAPAFTLNTLLSTNPNYTLMVQAIAKAGLTATFSPAASTPATVFAIDNATMTANGYDAATIAALSGASLTTLTNILRYHVVSSRNFSNAVKAGALKTVLGSNLVVSLSPGLSIKGISNPSAFSLTLTDIAASNGVLHGIGGMLKP